MNDALLVRRFKRLRDLLRNRERLIEGECAARDPLREILAFHELHDDECRRHSRLACLTGPALFQAVDRGDVGMIE